MKTELEYYDIYPKVVRADSETQITIRPLGRHTAFVGGQAYMVAVVPMFESKNYTDRPYEEVEVVATKNGLAFSYFFKGEQPYNLYVKRTDERESFTMMIYAVLPDLYELTPYMGDLHVHTHFSDGCEAPEYVAAQYRKCGFDFLAITDHGRYFPSLEAIEAYKDAEIALKLFPGEEVHTPGNNAHVVNFGSGFSVNELFHNDPERARSEITAIQSRLEIPEGVDGFAYASCCWSFGKIREGGGLAIFPHPHWIDGRAYHVSEKMTQLLFQNKPFDAFELIGGQTLTENMMQIARYFQARAEGLDCPIVGSSDSHGVINAEWFGIGRTIVFAKSNRKEDIIDAVKASRSVALETYAEENHPRVYGAFRLVNYAEFLLNEYFPLHDDLCYEEGRLMRCYINGDPEAKAALASLRNRTQKLIDKCWGR